jgi:formylmethanofuran dehydrogenase subunit E
MSFEITYMPSSRHGECEKCGKSFIRREIGANDDGKLCRKCYLEQKAVER